MKEIKTPAGSKRDALIGAIINNDNSRLKQLSALDGKPVILLDTFLDGLKYSSFAGKGDDYNVICTDNYNRMMQEISNDAPTSNSVYGHNIEK